MPQEKFQIFVSYSQKDYDRVRPFVDLLRQRFALRALPVGLWMDIESLRPGEAWTSSIEGALRKSIGFIFFVSNNSLQSDWVTRELSLVATSTEKLLIPVLLERALRLPETVRTRQWVDISQPSIERDYIAADQIASAVEQSISSTRPRKAAVSEFETPVLAAELAQEFRGSTGPKVSPEVNNSIFIVHGHGTTALRETEEHLAALGIIAVVLSRQDESPQSLFQKFMAVANKAQFAIVLLGADDYGASRIQYEIPAVRDRSLQFRARQNVILELGFFYGRLGWENVFVLHQAPDRLWPNFERPSDLDGIVFDSVTDSQWKSKLSTRLSEAGFQFSLRQ